jgi:hypothetical protein
MGWLAFRHSLALTFFGRMSKVGPLPSGKVMLSLSSSVSIAARIEPPMIALM